MSWINQYTPEAKARCACEDQLARLVAIEDCLRVAILHAWNETSFARIWDELTRAQDECTDLHVALVQLHEQLDAMVEENDHA